MTVSDRIRVNDVRLLSDNHYTLKTTTFEWRRANGEWQTQRRETYDRGNGAVLLPYNRTQRSVVLVKQFRYPAYVNGYDDLMIEAAAGLLDNASPEDRIRAEAEEKSVPMVQDIPLARALHGACELGDEIPVDFYRAVAGVLAFVMALKARGAGAGMHRMTSPAAAV